MKSKNQAEFIKKYDEEIDLSFKFINYIFSYTTTLVLKDLFINLYDENIKNIIFIDVSASLLCLIGCILVIQLKKEKLKQDKYFGIDKQFNEILNKLSNGKKRKFGISIKNVSTLYQHPWFASKREDNNFYGWLENNNIYFKSNKPYEKYVKLDNVRNKDLWVGSDSKELEINVLTSNKESLYVRAIVFDGNKVRKKQIIFPFISEYIGNTKEKLHDKISSKIDYDIEKIGIVAINENKDINELIVLVKVKNKITEDSYAYKNETGLRSLTDAIVNGKDDKERYAFLIFAYSKCKEDFIVYLNEELKNVKVSNRVANNHRLNLEEIGLDENKKASIFGILLSKFAESIYDLFSDENNVLLYAVFTFIISDLIFPIVSLLKEGTAYNQALESLKSRDFKYSLICIGIAFLIFVYSKWIAPHYAKLIGNLLNKSKLFPDVSIKGNLIKTHLGFDNTNIQHIDSNNIKINSILYKYKSKKIENELNDGEKFRLVECKTDEDNNSINLLVDSCRYTDIERFKKLFKLNNKNKEKYSKDYEIFLKGNNAVFEGTDFKNETRENIAPNSLCLHMIVVTKDNYVLFTKRKDNAAYEKSRYDFSIEEQLSREDFNNDGSRIKAWAKRALKEELGLEKKSCGMSNYFDIKIMGIFREEHYLNMAIAAIVRLKIDKSELLEILDSWPREDYEFKYNLITISDAIRFLQLGGNDNKYSLHRTATFRLFLLLKEQLRFISVIRFKHIIKNRTGS